MFLVAHDLPLLFCDKKVGLEPDAPYVLASHWLVI